METTEAAPSPIPTAEEAQAAAQEAQQGSPEGVTDEAMRQAMDITIAKFCGRDWETTSDPGMTARRKALVKIFKQLAAELGAPRPTAIPEVKRPRFLAMLDGISINQNTHLPEILPF